MGVITSKQHAKAATAARGYTPMNLVRLEPDLDTLYQIYCE
jgi:hypothetical protein